MAKKSKLSAYVRNPEMKSNDRTLLLLAAATESIPVAEAARLLGMSRKQCHLLANRGLLAFIEATDPKPAGRPAKPQSLRELEQEVEQLRRENHRLQEQAQTAERVLEAAAGMLKARVSSRQRAKKALPPGGNPAKKEEEPDGARLRLEHALKMKAAGATAKLCAALAGVSPATLRRWCARVRHDDEPRLSRGVSRRVAPAPAAASRAAQLVRDFHGCIGVESLRHRAIGVSRREAARIKAETKTLMERERKQECARVIVEHPGVVRGFDAMHVKMVHHVRYLLIAADAAVPFRTSCCAVEAYTGDAVAQALEQDFAAHGAPLVVRLDRAKQHETAEVRALLERHGVLVLHGPPHYPRFYGQLERQNREHRAWLEAAEHLEPETLELASQKMVCLFNTELPRRRLGFLTANDAWLSRRFISIDRGALRAEVAWLTRRIASHATSNDLAERLAIQTALAQHGLVRFQKGASVLPDLNAA